MDETKELGMALTYQTAKIIDISCQLRETIHRYKEEMRLLDGYNKILMEQVVTDLEEMLDSLLNKTQENKKAG